MNATGAGGTKPMPRNGERRKCDAKPGYKFGAAGKSKPAGITHLREQRYDLEPHVGRVTPVALPRAHASDRGAPRDTCVFCRAGDFCRGRRGYLLDPAPYSDMG